MTSPGAYALTIYQGATFQLRVIWQDSNRVPIDLTGYTARMQIRERLAATTTLANMTTENGGITLGGAAGTIDLLLTAVETAAISAIRGVYDLELVSPTGVVSKVLADEVDFVKEVTR
ncbi:hypothetical protein D9M73_70890 [compost metagenome]